MNLFLISPKNQRKTKKKAITSGRSAINIRKCTENKRRLSKVEKIMEECTLSIEECAEQQHSELIVEQIDTGSPSEQYRKCLDE